MMDCKSCSHYEPQDAIIKECVGNVLSERIKVFISSAQRNEKGFAWEETRRRIKEKLAKCACLNPFIIEDEASPKQSTQFYQMEVERSDLYVLLVKGEVRKGTFNEYTLAVKLKKPMLVYFLKDDHPNHEVEKIKQDLENYDRCTFRSVSNFDAIDDMVWSDIMKSLVREFLEKRFTTIEKETITTTFNYEVKKSSPGIPSKAEIEKFHSCYNYLYELLHLDFFKNDAKNSEWHDLGCSLIKWLVSGRWDIQDKTVKDIVSHGKVIFSDVKWLQKRWKAINAWNQGDLKKAFYEEKQALSLARKANESSWIINNILIDCRNIEAEIIIKDRKKRSTGKYQDELNSLNTMVNLPVLDRYHSNIYEYIEKDEFREKTASPYTELFGSNLSLALTDLANYLFTAAIYGSNTHLQLTRKIFAFILDKYSVIVDETEMAFEAVKQYVLWGNTTEFKSYIDYSWDNIYSFVAARADDIWALTDLVPEINKNSMKLSVISSLGLYFSDSVFKAVENYIYSYSDLVRSSTSDRYFDAILNNLHRYNANKIIQAIIPIISENRYSIGNKLSHIIMYINLEKAYKSNLKRLSIVLKEQLPQIMNNNGDPQMIAPLVQKNKEIFGELEHIDGNGLVGLQKSLYQINLGSEDWLPVLQEEIKAARIQFDKNTENNVFYGFSHDPYAMISNIIRKENNNNKIDQLIIQQFIPLSIDVLNSEAPVQTKEQCVACLCDVLSYFKNKHIELPESLKKAIFDVDIAKGKNFFSSSSRKSLEIRVVMAKILAEINDINSLLQWCLDFNNLNVKEKIVIVDCMERYLFYRSQNEEEISSLLLSIVLQCTTEKNPEIRATATKCLGYVVAGGQYEIATNALNETVFDPSVRVRMTLLRLCRSKILPQIITANILKQLRNDANYIIRKEARTRKVIE